MRVVLQQASMDAINEGEAATAADSEAAEELKKMQ